MPVNQLRISNLSVVYRLGRQETRALDNVSLDIPTSRYTIGIVGESGSGKTTLGMSILNLIRRPGEISSGTVEFEGKNVLQFDREHLRRYRGEDVAMIYQSAMNSLNPVKSILDHVTEVFKEHTSISDSEAKERAMALLSSVGIREDRVNGYPHEFSGGMRQRCVIAMALALKPKILIADEPTSALDVVVQRQILDLIASYVRDNGLSLVLITHEVALANGLLDNLAVMYKGELAEIGTTEKVLQNPLHPYSEMLIDSILTLESTRDALLQTDRRLRETSLSSTGNACKYATRCKYAFERCKQERPILKEVEKGRYVACHKYN